METLSMEFSVENVCSSAWQDEQVHQRGQRCRNKKAPSRRVRIWSAMVAKQLGAPPMTCSAWPAMACFVVRIPLSCKIDDSIKVPVGTGLGLWKPEPEWRTSWGRVQIRHLDLKILSLLK